MNPFTIRNQLRSIERMGYVLVFLPILSDFLETGRAPESPRQWLTEIVLGLLVLFYVRVIASSRKRLEKLEADRKEMMALTLHDMKNPLSVVMGTLSHLAENPEHPESRKWIKAALRSCQEDVDLMTELVEADRLEEQNLTISKGSVNVPDFLRRCAEEISAVAAGRGIRLMVSHGPEVETVFADEGLLKRVFMNLMRNALGFTSRGGQLDVRAEIQKDLLVVKVQDDGTGISPQKLDQIFGRFFRIREREGFSREGWGLGLYFCKLAIEAHGGKINISSPLGKGTLVQFAIPVNGASQKVNKNRDGFPENIQKVLP